MDVEEEEEDITLRRMRLRRKTDPKTGKHTLCKAAQSKGGQSTRASLYEWNSRGKMPDGNPATHVLCEPAQSKRTSTFHKSDLVWKFTGKMPDAPETTSIKHLALTLTVRIPQCGHTVWGTKSTLNKPCLQQTMRNPEETLTQP